MASHSQVLHQCFDFTVTFVKEVLVKFPDQLIPRAFQPECQSVYKTTKIMNILN